MNTTGQISTPKKEWPVWAKAFLDALSKTGVVGYSAKMADVHRTAPYYLRKEDPEFAAAWKSAMEEAVDIAVKEAWRRGIKGVKRPVYQGGQCVGYVREYSDTLLIFMLKAHRPGEYREKVSLEHTGAEGGPVVIRRINFIEPLDASDD